LGIDTTDRVLHCRRWRRANHGDTRSRGRCGWRRTICRAVPPIRSTRDSIKFSTNMTSTGTSRACANDSTPTTGGQVCCQDAASGCCWSATSRAWTLSARLRGGPPIRLRCASFSAWCCPRRRPTIRPSPARVAWSISRRTKRSSPGCGSAWPTSVSPSRMPMTATQRRASRHSLKRLSRSRRCNPMVTASKRSSATAVYRNRRRHSGFIGALVRRLSPLARHSI